ncbi:hypothetical protein ASE09_31960 [Streptomyces sp. Root66D1]|nr:hypothetical protein ASD33_32175 [Streptomyces sp. Root1304]KRA93501.1 hypothetical protein ASE09_31960 [Streptomyces sp. Root66D1]
MPTLPETVSAYVEAAATLGHRVQLRRDRITEAEYEGLVGPFRTVGSSPQGAFTFVYGNSSYATVGAIAQAWAGS